MLPDIVKSMIKVICLLFVILAEKSVSVGDLTGWGMLIPPSEENKDTDRLVICYLTINRNVVLTRVMYEPPGGLYPIVILPADGKLQ